MAHLIGKYLYTYNHCDSIVPCYLSFDKIIHVDEDYITLVNAKVILKGHSYVPSNEVGTKIYKIRIIYSKKGTKAKKDRQKLYDKAIENLNLKIWNNNFELNSSLYSTKDDFMLRGY